MQAGNSNSQAVAGMSAQASIAEAAAGIHTPQADNPHGAHPAAIAIAAAEPLAHKAVHPSAVRYKAEVAAAPSADAAQPRRRLGSPWLLSVTRGLGTTSSATTTDFTRLWRCFSLLFGYNALLATLRDQNEIIALEPKAH